MQISGAFWRCFPRDTGAFSGFYARRLGCGISDIEQLFRRMVFNVRAVNQDDHVKNFSFLMDRGGRWYLAPAYDLTSAYNPRNRWLSAHQMTVNGKNKRITESDMLAVGKTIGLSSKMCRKILEQTQKVTANWKHYAEKCGIREQTADNILKIMQQENEEER